MGREVAQDKNGVVQGDDPGKSLEKCLAPSPWVVNAERPGCIPHCQLCRLHLRVFPAKFQKKPSVVSLGEYVVHIGILNIPHYWKDAHWMASIMKLKFPNVGNFRRFSSSDELLIE